MTQKIEPESEEKKRFICYYFVYPFVVNFEYYKKKNVAH